jgi:large subunit ribosomal protein L17
MRHQLKGRRLGRNASHRLAMFRNMTRSLIEHGRIVTTEQKAKELRPFIERIITIAKRGVASGDPIKALHARRLVMARLGPVAKVELYDKNDEVTDDTVIQRLFNDLAPRYANRAGGYTRIIKRHERRLGDAGVTAFIELLKEGEVKVQATARREQAPAPAPAPVVAPSEPAAQPTA